MHTMRTAFLISIGSFLNDAAVGVVPVFIIYPCLEYDRSFSDLSQKADLITIVDTNLSSG